MLLLDQAFELFSQPFAFGMTNTPVVTQGLHPGIKGGWIVVLLVAQLSQVVQSGAALARRVQFDGNGQGLVIVALGLAILAQRSHGVAKPTQRSSFELLRALLLGNGQGVLKMLFSGQWLSLFK